MPEAATNVAIENVLAAVIDANGGALSVPAEQLKKDRSGFAIAIDYDEATSMVLFTLVESEDIEYDDDNNI